MKTTNNSQRYSDHQPTAAGLEIGPSPRAYLSHRVLRWTAMPVALVFTIVSSLILAVDHGIYALAGAARLDFYELAGLS